MSRMSEKALAPGRWMRKAGLALLLLRSFCKAISNTVRKPRELSRGSKLFSSVKELEITNLDRRLIRKPLSEQLAVAADNLPQGLSEKETESTTIPLSPTSTLTEKERQLILSIMQDTAQANQNNIKRTQAYLDIYLQHPELHWAFLAHMVSRNGGWNMTDLRGDLFARLLEKPQMEALFVVLEQVNALIFQDAYPQLQLYAESKRQGKPLFHLLPHMGVSRFMLPLWQQFWKEGHAPLLTIGLIINEQQYIQGRVVENRKLQEQAYPYPWEQLLQAALQLNQIVFPWLPEPSGREPMLSFGSSKTVAPALFGKVIENFSDLHERIEFGKQLYALLFADAARLRGFLRFAQAVPHSGSRADYWPHLFTRAATPPAVPSPHEEGSERLVSEAAQARRAAVPPRAGAAFAAAAVREAAQVAQVAQAAAPRHVSPALGDAWADRPLGEVERYDWFGDLSAVAYLTTAKLAEPIDITHEHSACWHKLELAAAARELAAE